MTKHTIMIISPSLTVKGGISSLIDSYLASDLAAKYSILNVYTHVSGSKMLKAVQAVRGFFHALMLLSFRQVDIVHFHGGGSVSALRKCVFFHLVKLFGCKVIYHLHGGAFPQQYQQLPRRFQAVIANMFQRADLVICLSESFRKEVKAIAPRANIIVEMNSVPLPQQVNCHDSTDEVRIVYLGLINEKKGFFDLLAVMGKICRDNDNVRLLVGGLGEEQRMRREMEALGITTRVEYLGWLEAEERDNLLGTADILALPSYGEGMPMSILEAMSFGIPILATNVGGVPDIVLDGETGFLVQAGDLEQLYDRLMALIRDPNLRMAMGARGRRLVEQRHTLDKAIERIDVMYGSLTNEIPISFPASLTD
jgi:glycosyltransferase involved in cell wall biosynthesis